MNCKKCGKDIDLSKFFVSRENKGELENFHLFCAIDMMHDTINNDLEKIKKTD